MYVHPEFERNNIVWLIVWQENKRDKTAMNWIQFEKKQKTEKINFNVV